MAWAGHALISQPLDFFQANQFYPERDFAFGDMLIGYAPFGLFADSPHAAVVGYDLAFLFAYALAFLGPIFSLASWGSARPAPRWRGCVRVRALPARARRPYAGDLHRRHPAGAGAGAARASASGAPGPFAAWAVAAWQVSLGFALGLPLIYLIALAWAIAAVVWWRRGRPPIERRMMIAGAAGALVFAVAVALIAAPYFRVADAHPEAVRSPETIEVFSDGPRMFLAAPAENSLWGGATEAVRDGLDPVPEKTLFPGLLTLVLAAVGLGSTSFRAGCESRSARLRSMASVLALGFQAEDGFLWPYRFVYQLPGWDGLRTPGRLVTFSSLALALLAAAGAEAALRAVAPAQRRRQRGHRARRPARRRDASGRRSQPS